MSTKKKYLKSKPVCKVSFTVSTDLAKNASKATIVGDFNEWNETSDAMKKLKNGSFKATLDLESGKKYEFRYLIDGETWINDDAADAYVSNDYGEENSVVDL